ncbi:MAG: sulfite oxidase-like oxidoreductase [Nitrospinae bacterium]|nr:sulfite oxidase-like oxidoreductase [Nitrospinota bacterium]
MSEKKRLPPGQRLTQEFPILHFGGVPDFDRARWSFRIFGAVAEEKTLTYDRFLALPNTERTEDFHCVTGWSRYDNRWTGVSSRTVAGLVTLLPGAAHVLVHGEQNYTTNLPLAEFLDDDVLFAWRHDGADLTPEHGYPLRLVVPKLYAWKSAKWVRGIEFMTEDQRGFWESYGYHNHGDPWTEERYSSQE